jgi:D-alanyl-D-alanine carboxypeptidase
MLNELRSFTHRFAKAITIAAVALGLTVSAADARRHHRSWSGSVSRTDPAKDAALIVDGSTGRVVYARNADLERHPASLTKMMTLYLLFDALKQGKVSMTTPLHVSYHAAAQKPTNLHLAAGDQIPVETAIRAIVVRSANDVAVAIAEGIGGTESHFAELMTEKARELGMRSTYYHNASGLPDSLQITTASDLAVLARRLAYDFPQYFHFFATPSFYFRGINYPTHDNLIGRYDGADGIKTGYTGMSGFNLVSSVVRRGAHVIGVVMGGRTAHSRDREMVGLLDWTFGQISRNPSLVAHTQLPWLAVAQNTAVSPITINAAAQSPSPPLVTPTTTTTGAPALAMAAPQPTLPFASDDEETAEARTSEGNADLAPQAAPAADMKPLAAPKPGATPTAPLIATSKPSTAAPVPQPAIPTAVKPPAPVKVAQLIKPRHKPALAEPQAQPPVLVASNLPVPRLRPSNPVLETGEGDIGDDRGGSASVAMPSNAWMIQIGAFPTQPLARAQLAAYAQKSMDVLGQAARVVLPLQSVDGHVVYRARFGPFPEREAREVCSRLTQRGQTCFAAVATR